tara:strand:+ start:3447 stop:4631 length:1185 start_codon:yes stop_codon:yes gene_type:complete
MGGGLMQLVAYGAQDIYLTGNPQITFWKVVYRRCTNFAIESVEQTFMGNAAAGARASATISRNGDLVSNCVLEINATQHADGPLSTAGMHHLVESVEVEIGGQKIDKHYSAWLQIWNELSNSHFGPNTADSAPAVSGYGKAIGSSLDSNAEEIYHVPLVFWFNRNPGLALPLIALQYHEVKFNFQFAPRSDIQKHNTNLITVNSIKLFVDYIYLDTEERRRFAQQQHEYLIDQVQYTGSVSRTAGTGGMQSLRLDFNHPCKELIWVERQTTRAATTGFPTDFVEIGGTAASSALLQLNGHDRFAKRPMCYFTRVQPLQHHTNVPHGDRIGVYSFGLRPEDHQPSGTCNFSRIDNATLQLTLAHANGQANEFQVYATNYNVLRIMSGMGGLAYSN